MNNNAEIDFSFNLFRKLAAESTVISPISIRLAFALAHLGARGSSRSEIVRTLSGDIDDDEFLSSHTKLCQELNTKRIRKTFKLANRAFFNKEYTILPSYLKEISERYSAEAVTADFEDKGHVAQTVNTFVSDSTGGMIKDLLSSGDIEDNTIAFLVNAAYFDEDWKSKFVETCTVEGDFYEQENKTHKVKFMHQLDYFDYFENEKFQVLSMSYTHADFSFVILLPKERCKLNETFETFTAEEFNHCLNSMSSAQVQLKLPKMNIDTKFKLEETLKNLGIRAIFDSDTADLWNMIEEKKGMMNPYIQKAIHRATIEVTEDGTVATAGTVLSCASGSSQDPPKIIPFIADHPFIFCILYKKEHVLFIGKMCGQSLPSSNLDASHKRKYKLIPEKTDGVLIINWIEPVNKKSKDDDDDE